MVNCVHGTRSNQAFLSFWEWIHALRIEVFISGAHEYIYAYQKFKIVPFCTTDNSFTKYGRMKQHRRKHIALRRPTNERKWETKPASGCRCDGEEQQHFGLMRFRKYYGFNILIIDVNAFAHSCLRTDLHTHNTLIIQFISYGIHNLSYLWHFLLLLLFVFKLDENKINRSFECVYAGVHAIANHGQFVLSGRMSHHYGWITFTIGYLNSCLFIIYDVEFWKFIKIHFIRWFRGIFLFICGWKKNRFN